MNSELIIRGGRPTGENKSVQNFHCCFGKKGIGQGTHLFVALDLGIDKGPQYVRCERQIDMDELCLLVQAIQREVIPKLHS